MPPSPDGLCGAWIRGSNKTRTCHAPPLPGCNRCADHGGAHPFAQQKARLILAEAGARKEMLKLGLPEPVKISHVEAMIWLVSAKYAEVRWLRAHVQELGDTDLVWSKTQEKNTSSLIAVGNSDSETFEAGASIWWVMLRTAEDQLIKFASAAHAAGVADAEVDLAKQRGQMLGLFLDNLMAALCAMLVEAGVTREDFPDVWASSIADLFPRHFRALGAVPA